MGKRRKPRISHTQAQVLSREQINISREINYIIGRAKNSDARLVTLGALVLFSTETGDAWLLDSEEGLALCLARDGQKQSFTIVETPANFGIEWTANYRIDGDMFIVIEQSGQVKSILGYPTREIVRAGHQTR
jgi:hypothetical protein